MAPPRVKVTSFGAVPPRPSRERPQVALSTVESAFARRLAHTDKKVRNRGFDFVEEWLLSKRDRRLTSIECLRMWKAVFHGYWLVDKYHPQLKFCVRAAMFTRLVNNSNDNYVTFCSAFYIIMTDEWKNICHHRVDKYFLLFKVFFTELLDRTRSLQWNDQAVKDLLSILGLHGPLRPFAGIESHDNSSGDNPRSTGDVESVAKTNRVRRVPDTTGTDIPLVVRQDVSSGSIGISLHFLLNFVKQLDEVSNDPTPVKPLATTGGIKSNTKSKTTSKNSTTPTADGPTADDDFSDDCDDLFKQFTNPHLDEDEIHAIRLKALTGRATRRYTHDSVDAQESVQVMPASCPCPKVVLEKLLGPMIDYSVRGSNLPLLCSIHTHVFQKMSDTLWQLPDWAVKLFVIAAKSDMSMKNRNLFYNTIDELDTRKQYTCTVQH
eukprot:Lankesteria_metandrocarpae@DN3658_c0_g1_i3.p1